MTRFSFLSAGLLALVVVAQSVAAAPTDLHLFLLGGQSNMSGRGTLTETNRVDHARVFVLTKSGEWRPATEPFHWEKPKANGAGLAASFARAYADAHPGVNVGLVPVAYGGSPISSWQPGRVHFTNAVALARVALKSGTFKGFLWHQGESDSFTMDRVKGYVPLFTNAITRLRQELGIENVPFVAGELGPYLRNWQDPKRPNLYWQAMNAEIARGVRLLPKAILVPAAGLEDVRADRIHFETPSLRRFGLRYYSSFRVLEMMSGDFRTAWCDAGATRGRTEPLASELGSLSSMVNEWRQRESVRADGTFFIDFSKVKSEGNRDFFLNLRSRSAFNAKAFYFGEFRHDLADYGRFLETHPNFLGFESWEWGNDAYLPIRKPGVLTSSQRTNALSEDELKTVLAKTPVPPDRDAFIKQLLRPVFDRICDWNLNDPKRLLLGEGHYCIEHLAAYWGAGQLGIETTRDYYFWQIQMMFCRGAAHQFDLPWKWYVAGYLDGFENGARRDGSYYAEPDGRPWHGPQYGISQSAIKRVTYLTYLSGANWYERENMFATHFLTKGGAPRLSEEGEMFNRFHAFTKRVDRGRPFVPFALLVPANRGYTRKTGKAFDRYDYTRADYSLDALMSVILDFPANRRAENFTNHVERVMANSPYGDCFDVLTPDFADASAFARAIGDYRIAFLVGDYGRNPALERILQNYVENGGWLVMSVAQQETFPIVPSRLKQMSNAAFSSAEIGQGRVIVGRTPHFVPWFGDDEAGRQKALRSTRIGASVDFPELKGLLDELKERVLPIRVTGAVQYGINQVEDGWLVYLINNAGVVKYPDRVQQIASGGTSVVIEPCQADVKSVEELVDGGAVRQEGGRYVVEVPYGDIRVLKISRSL